MSDANNRPTTNGESAETEAASNTENGGAPVSISQQENIEGGGASDRYSNRQSGEIDGGDTDKHGIKPPDAMGAGS